MKKIFSFALVFVIGFVVSDYLGIPLKNLVKPVYRLLPISVWLIIGLTLVIGLLLFLVEGARRLLKRVINEIYQHSDGIAREYSDCAATVEGFTLMLGRTESLYFLLENRRWDQKPPVSLSREEIQYYESDIHNLLTKFGNPDHLENLGSIPTDVDGQLARIKAHMNVLQGFIRSERGQRESIGAKAAWQRQESQNSLG